MLDENLSVVNKNIQNASVRSNRNFESVKIIAVSKNQSIQKILELHALGILDFGENKVQEAEKKISAINAASPKNNLVWHFIGRLQTNKVKKAISLFETIHSVDSIALAEKINMESGKKKKIQKVLLQINVSGEKSKTGFSENDLTSLFPKLLSLPNLKILGLMTIAPISENPENSRPIFEKLRKIRDSLEKNYKVQLTELSMGMSQDYGAAIEEGATMVRIGTALFKNG